MLVQTKPIPVLADVVLGLQWGDECKGKFVDFISPQYDIIARFNGGPNAGHTLVHNGIKCATHSLPSGVLDPDKFNLIGAGCVINPGKLLQEILDIEKLTPHSLFGRVFIAEEASLIVPAHIMLDAVQDKREQVNTTKQGIAQAYTNFSERTGLWVGLARDKKRLRSSYDKLTQEILVKIAAIEGRNISDLQVDQAVTDGWFNALEKVLDRCPIVNCVDYVHSQMEMGKKILLEGAQGALLDPRFGCSYPFVTSSHTTSGGACTGSGLGPKHIGAIYGITKAYTTRVGNGPFPTKIEGQDAEVLRKEGDERGSTTGRIRDVGWLDLPALLYAIRINSVTDVILAKIDILGLLSEIKVCVRYEDATGKTVPFSPQRIEELTPIYETFEGGWSGVKEVTSYDMLPEGAKKYVEFVQSMLPAPITYISNGPETEKIFEVPAYVFEKV